MSLALPWTVLCSFFEELVVDCSQSIKWTRQAFSAFNISVAITYYNFLFLPLLNENVLLSVKMHKNPLNLCTCHTLDRLTILCIAVNKKISLSSTNFHKRNLQLRKQYSYILYVWRTLDYNPRIPYVDCQILMTMHECKHVHSSATEPVHLFKPIRLLVTRSAFSCRLQ